MKPPLNGIMKVPDPGFEGAQGHPVDRPGSEPLLPERGGPEILARENAAIDAIEAVLDGKKPKRIPGGFSLFTKAA